MAASRRIDPSYIPRWGERVSRRRLISVALTGVLLTGVTAYFAETSSVSDEPVAAAQIDGTALDQLTIPEFQAKRGRGATTSVALTKAYLKRINDLNPKLHAVIVVNDKALDEAKASDGRKRRSPMDGVPVLLKDNIDTADLPTTAGSRALNDSRPKKDAELVRRLRAAGAVILGKANLSEWANFRAAKPTSGWSANGGLTANPYVLDRNACGSSSGSGASVAASLAQVAIGSETDGSIVCPAGMNGLAAVKPSLGLVSGAGVVPISAEQDTAGPMARHVIDAALTLNAIRGGTADFATADANVLRGARIGVWRLPVVGEDADRVLTESVKVLESLGATAVPVEVPYQERIGELEFPALLTEFRRDINKYLATRDGKNKTLADLIEYNKNDRLEQTCFPGQELFEQAEQAPRPDDPQYQKNRAELTDLAKRSIDETIEANDLDAIVSPTNPPAWISDCARGDNDIIPSSTPAAVSGYPHVVVPAGFGGPQRALPIGLSLFAGNFTDAKLLAIGAAFEHAHPVRKAPTLLPTVG
ncbi:amidase [Pseudonocardiaceae bacterium YIM PH 21723]|nr:amidase [Pseudonocardiaceae bacterium YIM PH 21723]